MRAFIVFILLACSGMAEDSIDRVNAKYLNKQVVVNSSAFFRAIKENGKFVQDPAYAFLPDSYVGQSATIIAIQPIVSNIPEKMNALGEPVTPKLPAKFDFIVQFEDGYTAIRKMETESGIRLAVMLPDQRLAAQQLEEANKIKATGLNGKVVYAIARSKVYRLDVSRTEMDDSHRINVPLLEPLRIAVAKWDKDSGCALAKLELPNGYGLALVSLDDREECGQSEFLFSVPKYLTVKEKAAIKQRTPVRGMSELALWYAIGFPETENDYGRAGRQLVYPGNVLVYVNTQGTVEDIQRMGH